MPIRTRLILVLLTTLGGVGCAAGSGSTAPPVMSLSGGDAPHIDSVSFKPQPPGSDLVQPELHFHAAHGDVRSIDQTVVETTGPSFKVDSGSVDVSSAKQEAGGIYTFDLRCGPGAYRVKIRAYLVDRAGDHSNTVEYLVRCNGG